MRKITKLLTVIISVMLMVFTGCKKSSDVLDSGGNTQKWENGILPGVFFTGSRYVHFSQGNLQYQASTNTWRFAENQWDFVGCSASEPNGTVPGSSNHYISSTYDGWIDLFGWGTSGYPHGAVCYQPWSVLTFARDYVAYGCYECNYHLYEQTGQADWGYNAIRNGGNKENTWRTLTRDEWRFLLNDRNTISGIRYAKAKVNGVKGVLLLPDDWDNSTYSLINTNISDVSCENNIITLSDWNNILEANGAVFLPCAGWRKGSDASVGGYHGLYWSSSCHYYTNYDPNAIFFEVNDRECGLFSYERCYGNSVRLVTR